MSSQLFKGKEQIFRDVIHLAEAWKTAHDTSGFDGGSVKEIHVFEATPAGQKIQAAKNTLSNYLTNLNFSDVKMLQTVMYFGRERDDYKLLSHTDIYIDYIRFSGRKGWNTKEIEINQMTSKIPLADYLKSGLEILNVTI